MLQTQQVDEKERHELMRINGGLKIIDIAGLDGILKDVPNKGLLKRRPDEHEYGGMLYLKVSELFIEKLFPLIKEDEGLDKGSSTLGIVK